MRSGAGPLAKVTAARRAAGPRRAARLDTVRRTLVSLPAAELPAYLPEARDAVGDEAVIAALVARGGRGGWLRRGWLAARRWASRELAAVLACTGWLWVEMRIRMWNLWHR